MRPDVVTKIIPADGGVIEIDGFILKTGPGCRAEDTKITLKKQPDRDIAIKSMLDLGLLKVAPRDVEFLPNGLKFLKPADLTIRFRNTVSDSKPFILHGSYRRDYQKIVWEPVTNGIEVNNVEGIVNAKINGFCLYSHILARCGMLGPIVSHLNHSFTCCTYVLYRRKPTMDTLDISVVIISEFVDDDKGEDIKQLKNHLDLGYIKGEKGVLKPVHTDRRLEMSLHFPGVENFPFSFGVNESLLDSVGFVIDHFQEIAIKSPVRGKVKISEAQRSEKKELLWSMNICETKEQFGVKEAEVQYLNPEPEGTNPEPEVVYSNTKLTKGEITRMSRKVELDWDNLAGLMDIPYSDREEIRVDYLNYPGIRSKAKKVFELVNDSTFFNRHILVKYFKELGRHDLEKEMIPVEDQNGSDEVETSPTPPVIAEEDLLHTPLSPREMSRLARRIVVEWKRLADLMDIPGADTVDIQYNLIYNDDRSRAEKILASFNNKEDFSREKLARCLEELQQLDLIEPVLTGEWRKL
ncbi:---NA--- [Paramuricea clavata]|uniref:---NA n=1 Tax=Paramuricea clavata TaxID=317549 RepID=A0A7D9L0G7_PARCT|nr:---NA--- [Paramuricea clavata]